MTCCWVGDFFGMCIVEQLCYFEQEVNQEGLVLGGNYEKNHFVEWKNC